MSSIAIYDLSDGEVVHLTKLLARRPEYGIAIPSRRWLQRQQEKMKCLPKALLRPSAFKRLALKIANTIDPNIVDPQAVLCTVHSNLNPFLVRRLFIALAYEVTVYTDPLRSWTGRISNPEISAFIGRLDSIAALWTEPELFQEIYGATPFDSHHIFVKSMCEACCLAAVGASGRALADLRAALIDRIERRTPTPSGKEPRLRRFVESWIDHLHKGDKGVSRADACRSMSESLLTELRTVRSQVQSWRAEQKQQHALLRAAKRPIYAELKRTPSGTHITPLPSSGPHRRRTRNGIPVALADTLGAEGQREAATREDGGESIYRPDSIAGYSIIHKQQRAAYGLSADAGPRRSNPEEAQAEGNNGETWSFIGQFDQETAPDHNRDPYDDGGDPEPYDQDHIEASRAKVEAWWTSRLSKSRLNALDDDGKSVLSKMHPAFRADSEIAPSALPDPLEVKHDSEPRNDAASMFSKAPSEWTDCSVDTYDPDLVHLDIKDIPPVPPLPSPYQQHEGSQGSQGPKGVDGTSQAPHEADGSSKKGKHSPPNWPAPPQGRPPSIPVYPGPINKRSSLACSEAPPISGSTSPYAKSTTPKMYASSSVYDNDSTTSILSLGTMATGFKGIKRDAADYIDLVQPDDSASNTHWNECGGAKPIAESNNPGK